MNGPLAIRFGDTAATVYLDAPEGRATSVTSVTVYEDANSDTGTTETALGSPAVETNPATTFDAASGVSQATPNRCNLTATTGIAVGRTYLITNAYSEREWVEVTAISSGAYVDVRSDLQRDYAAADTFVSTRISATVDATWIADTSNVSHPLCPFPRWRAAFLYTVGGVVYRSVRSFDVTRYPWHHSVTAVDVDRRSRGWLFRLATEDQRGPEETVDEAAHLVKVDLWERGVADYALRNSAVLNELVTLRAIALVAEQSYMHGGNNRAQLDMASAAYFDRFTKFVDAGLVPVQSSEDGAGAPVDRSPVWRR
jgi:hypothetical protein